MVDQISKTVLDGGWEDHTSMRFCWTEKESTGQAAKAQQFLRLLNSYIEPHIKLREARETNYEDLHAAALQISQDETSELVNPMLRGSLADLRAKAANLYDGETGDPHGNPFVSLVERATNLIDWAVVHCLIHLQKPIGMSAITAVAKATERLDIFSVNHDLLIERQFEAIQMPFADGFGQREGDVRKFAWSWDPSVPVRLYKLHGSIDWYPFNFPNGERQFARVLGKNTGLVGDPEHSKDETGTYLSLTNNVPLILAGTTDKERRYGFGLPGEIFFEVHKQLQNHHTLICSGYGWADKGINNKIGQWLSRDAGNKLVLLHETPEEIMKKRFWTHRWARNQEMGKIVVIRKWLQDCTIDDLSPFFDE